MNHSNWFTGSQDCEPSQNLLFLASHEYPHIICIYVRVCIFVYQWYKPNWLPVWAKIHGSFSSSRWNPGDWDTNLNPPNYGKIGFDQSPWMVQATKRLWLRPDTNIAGERTFGEPGDGWEISHWYTTYIYIHTYMSYCMIIILHEISHLYV